MRFTTHLAVFMLCCALAVSLWGCGSSGPMGPGDDGTTGKFASAKEIVKAAEGTWQMVELSRCNPGKALVDDPVRPGNPTGQLRYRVSSVRVFQCEIQLSHLKGNHEYLLTVVGRSDLPGSSEEYYNAGVVFYDHYAPFPYTGLPTRRGGWQRGKEYCDFALVITDQNGSVEESFQTILPAGTYEVIFTVKDARMWTHYAKTGNFDTEVLDSDDANFKIFSQLSPLDR